MFEYYVKQVTGVVDGDTIDVVIDLGFDISFTSRVRLAGIDTPESRTKDLQEKALGIESKAYLAKVLKTAKNIVIRTEKMMGFMLEIVDERDRLIENRLKGN